MIDTNKILDELIAAAKKERDNPALERLRAVAKALHNLESDKTRIVHDSVTLMQTIQEQQHRVRKLAQFVFMALDASSMGGDLDGDRIQERGLELGVLERVAFDPAIHHDQSGACDPGDEFYVLSDWMQELYDAQD